MHYSLTRATAWNLLGYLYLILAALISTPIIVRYLGVSSFAQYALVIATLTLVSSLDLGLPQAVVRALSREHVYSPKRQTLWATSSCLFIMAGLIGGLLSVFIAFSLSLSPTYYLPIFALALLNNIVSHYQTLPQSEGHFGYYNAKTFIVGTSNTLLAAYLSWTTRSLEMIILALLASYLVTLIPLVYFSLKYFPRPRLGRPSLVVAKSLIAFGLKNQVGKLVGQAQSQYGKYLLRALSPLSLSAYVIAQGLVQKLVGGVSQLATALYPTSARQDRTTSLAHLYLRLQLGLLVLGIFAVVLYGFVGLPFLTWWLGDLALVDTIHQFLLVYRFYGLLLLLTPLASTILDSTGHPGTTSILGTIAFLVELVSALYLLPSYGLLAPAYAGIISLSVMTPAILVYAHRQLHHPPTT